MAALVAVLWPQGSARLHAQGITTTELRGSVLPASEESGGVTRVRVTNMTTGFSVETEVRRGAFLVQGLEIGGPYVVVVRRIGFTPQERRGLMLGLGQTLDLAFVLTPSPTRLDTVTVVAENDASAPRSNAGIGATISDSLLHRLPTLNRDIYDFARLAPQISSKIGLPNRGGLTGGGVGLRFNSYLIDGTSDRAQTGNSSTADAAGKSVSIEAVQEYQVLLAPFDVRYGDFAGTLVNTVTKSGTNELTGSTFAYWRNNRLAGGTDLAQMPPYDREQFGFFVGGPIIRDRLHFVVATEVQRLVSPAPGPYLGQSPTASPALPVRASDVTRFGQLLQGYGLTAGSAGVVQTTNPLTNAFARFDLALPRWRSTVVATERYARNSNHSFSRATADTFSLSSYSTNGEFAALYSSVQLRTNLVGGGYNELIVSHEFTGSTRTPDAREPTLQVVVPGTSGAVEILKAGSAEGFEDAYQRWWSAGLADNLTVPLGGEHLLTLGAQSEVDGIRNGGVTAQYGAWTFSSLDSLERGQADRYTIRRDFGSVSVPLRGIQYGAYAGDRWRASDGLTLTLGLRLDGLIVSGQAPYNAPIDSLFGRRTDLMPASHLHLSPRFGFTWDPSGTGRDELRGGIGIFTGRPPLSWLHAALYSYGVGAGVLRCGSLPSDAGPVPKFNPDYRSAPGACANGREVSATPNGDVDLLDRHLRMAQTLRTSIAYDRRLPWDVTAGVDALVTKNVSDFLFVNLNLKGPQDVDRHGRVLYGAINSAGVATPALVSKFSEVIDLRNDSQNHSDEVSVRLEKRYSTRMAVTASYTFSSVRDVQLPLRAGMPGIIDWGTGRTVSGRHDDLRAETSLYDLPHRVVVAATYNAPWGGRRHTTDLSMYYVGESGNPVTYVASGVGGRGDLNADGWTGNDPLYIPKSAFDTNEIRFAGPPDSVSLQQAAFERRIGDTPCLSRQRGRILARNSCREPWSNTTIAAIRQSLLVMHGHVLALQLDVFNVLNLLQSHSGRYQVADPALLQQVGETAGPPATAQPIFRLDLTKPPWTTLPTLSTYQLQLSARYTF